VESWTRRRVASRRAVAPSSGATPNERVHDRRRRVRPVALGVLLAAAAALAACGGSSNGGSTAGGATSGQTVDTAPASVGGTLRLARSVEPVTLNPYACACENGSWQTIVQVHDTLVEYMPDTSDVVPGLAERWEVSADKKTFTFHLRDAKFSNGAPVTADDVKYSLGRATNPRYPYYGLYSVIRRVDAPDPRTVVIRLRQPTIGFLWYVGFPGSSILPRAEVERVGDEAFGRRPIGAGAFTVKRWVKGQVVELARNPHYWRRGQPYLDEVHFLYVPNDNTRTLDLLSGNVDAVDAVPFSQIDQVDGSGQARVLLQVSSGMYPVWLNERYAPLDETAVRQALNYATPLEQIQQVVFGGRAEIANTNLPKLRDWTDEVEHYPYDVARARALMARSSKPQGFDLTLDLVSGDETTKQVAQILQDAWGEIGVRLRMRQSDYGTMITRVANFQHQAYIPPPDQFTSDLPVLDQFANLLYADLDSPLHNVWTWYDNPEAAALASEAVHARDEAEQTRLFAELQRVTMEDPPAVSLVYPQYRSASRENVKGFQFVQTGWWRLEQVSLER
jgi:peptide/nickel transport system substrate-binding protein